MPDEVVAELVESLRPAGVASRPLPQLLGMALLLGAFELSFAMSFRGFTRVDGSAQVTSLQSRRDRWTRTGTRTGTQCPTRSIPS